MRTEALQYLVSSSAGRYTVDRHREAFDRTTTPMAFVDLDGRYLDANDSLCRLLGRSRAEIASSRPTDLVTVIDGEDITSQVRAALEDADTSLGGTFLVTRPDGTTKCAHAGVVLVRDADENPDYFFVQVQDLTQLRDAETTLAATNGALERALDSAVLAMSRALELRDPYTADHQARVAEHARAIAERIGLDPHDADGIAIAASIHDIGKIAVPSEILNRPGRLSAAEMGVVMSHAQAGHDIVVGIDFPWPVARMILEHHERADGSGYPNRRIAGEVLLGSSIIGVADAVDAMSSHRPYRPALGLEAALDAITAGRGTTFHPGVVDAAVAHYTAAAVDGLDTALRFGEFSIDNRRRVVSVSGRAIPLTRREFDLLAALAAEPGRTFTRDELLQAVWHSRSEWQTPATVTEHIRRIRTKLAGTTTRIPAIATIRGVGYALDPNPRLRSAN